MISIEQAEDLIEFIRYEIDSNGFQNVNDEVHIRLMELFDDDNDQKLIFDPIAMLRWYLANIIEVFTSLSNNGVIEKSIDRINEAIGGEFGIQSILVQYDEATEKDAIDLKTLPDYSRLLNTFTNISETLYRN